MIDARATITVSLPAERWQAVLSLMAEAPVPHRIADPLIREIHQQCMQADRPDNVTALREAAADAS